MDNFWFHMRDHIDGAGPVNYMATVGWVELCDNGHADGSFTAFRHDDCVVWASNEHDEIVSLIVYRVESPNKASIQLGYVTPKERFNGHYKRLLGFLESVLEDKGVRVYETVVHDTNSNMRGIHSTRTAVGTLARKVIRTVN